MTASLAPVIGPRDWHMIQVGPSQLFPRISQRGAIAIQTHCLPPDGAGASFPGPALFYPSMS